MPSLAVIIFDAVTSHVLFDVRQGIVSVPLNLLLHMAVDTAHLRAHDKASALCCICQMPLLHMWILSSSLIGPTSWYGCSMPSLVVIIFDAVTSHVLFDVWQGVVSVLLGLLLYMILIFERVTKEVHFVAMPHDST
jgi:hypothetical protein